MDSSSLSRNASRARRNWVTLPALAVAILSVCVWRYMATTPAFRLARGEEAIQSGDWEASEEYATKLEASGFPDHAHFLRGKKLHTQHRPAPALAEFNRIRGDGPIRLRSAVLSGLCLIELRNLPEAVRVLAYVIGEQPDNVEAHRGLAVIAYDLGQLGTAVVHLEEVARLDPADARPHRLIGLINKDLAQNEEAAAAYREALSRKLSPAVASEVRIELAEVLVRLALFAEGLDALDADAAAGSERNPARSGVRAECLRGLGRRREAVELLDLALASSSSADLYRLRGQFHLDDAEHTESVRALEQAAALAPADYRTHYLLAQAYSAAGRKDDATKTSTRAEELRKDLDLMTKLSREAIDKPWDEVVRLQLAELSDRLGKPQLAAMWRAAAAACRQRR